MPIHNPKGQTWTLVAISLILRIGWGEHEGGNPGGPIHAGQGRQSGVTNNPVLMVAQPPNFIFL